MTATGGLSDQRISGNQVALTIKQQALGMTLQRIERAVLAAKRPPQCVELVAVSKKFDALAVLEIANCGQLAFGENFVQEGCQKIRDIKPVRPDLIWHFIGPLQSNKTRPVAELFDWVDSVDRLKIAQRLSEQRPKALAPLQLCIQVNISGEVTKSGCTPTELNDLVSAIAELPNCQLRGLMCIPEPLEGRAEESLIQQFEQMNQLLIQAKNRLLKDGLDAGLFDTLSMGMSGDIELAVACGSTSVRVGTAIFGARPTKSADI